ncbi:MAG: hypothetical protein KAS23_13515 [Anaerohalosphaera sp.]|nr:hypothetical protein [Anaerohalosphaera sp.]
MLKPLIRSEFGNVILLSGIMGFCLGLSNVTWQVSVETGQVLASLVNYPPDNPFYMYHLKAFTLVNHFSASLLHLGVSERAISFLISGMLGMVSFQGLALLIFAIGRNVKISLLGVLLVYLANYVGYGVVYPIWLLGRIHTYGILSLSLTVLIVALLGNNKNSSALFLLGLLPCVHASMGFWLIITICLSAVFQWDYVSNILRKHYRSFLLGFLISLALLCYQFYLMRQLPTIDPEIQKRYLDSFVKYWGSHRIKMFWGYSGPDGSDRIYGLIFCFYGLVTSFLGMKLFKAKDSLLFLFRLILVWGIASLVAGLITQLPPEKVPSFLLILMPGRYVNLSNLVLPACLIGCLVSEKCRDYELNCKLFVGFLILTFFARNEEVQVILFAIIILWLFCLAYNKSLNFDRNKFYAVKKNTLGYAAMLAVFIPVYLAVNLPRERYFKKYIYKGEKLADWTNDVFYAMISKREGLLVASHDSTLIQLKTRRPILADMTSVNFFTYAPESTVVFNNILLEVYSIDLLKEPPAEYLHSQIPPDMYRQLWENRTVERWQEIRQEFGITDILTGWTLDLPVIAQGEHGILYTIPPAATVHSGR